MVCKSLSEKTYCSKDLSSHLRSSTLTMLAVSSEDTLLEQWPARTAQRGGTSGPQEPLGYFYTMETDWYPKQP